MGSGGLPLFGARATFTTALATAFTTTFTSFATALAALTSVPAAFAAFATGCALGTCLIGFTLSRRRSRFHGAAFTA